VAIHIYDHHFGWESAEGKAIKLSCKSFTVLDKKTTAAAIVWSRFLNAEKASQRWMKVLAERDRSPQEDVRRDFGILAALMQRQHWNLQVGALRELACGRSLSEQIRCLSDWYYQEHRARERTIANRAEVMTTQGGRRIAWLDLRAEKQHFMVGPDIISQHKVELAITVIGKGIMVGGASIDQGVDLLGLHGRHEVDGVRLEIAGHKSPVRISPVDGMVDDRFVAAARAFIMSRL
jgi:hypothetical protein